MFFYEFQDAAELVLLVLDEARTACAFSSAWRHDEHRNAKAPTTPHDDNRSLRSGDHTC
jgi:hypothetical protein